jgi:enoyl-CoA hydratase/carnithine racemase
VRAYGDLRFLDVEIDRGVAVVRLAGPEPGNAISFEGHAELSAILPRLGRVTEVVDPGASFERAMVWARRFAAGPGPALRHTKRALNQWLRLGMPAFDLSWAGEIPTVATPEARAASQALARGALHLRSRHPRRVVVRPPRVSIA